MLLLSCSERAREREQERSSVMSGEKNAFFHEWSPSGKNANPPGTACSIEEKGETRPKAIRSLDGVTYRPNPLIPSFIGMVDDEPWVVG
jgi:hypothetical protein